MTLVLKQIGGEQREFVLEKASFTIGRALSSAIVISDPKVSRSHARIDNGETCVIRDLDSGNRTLVNGRPVDEAILTPGDMVSLGETHLRLEERDAEPDESANATVVINTAGELDTVLAQSTVSATISNTSQPRLAVLAFGETREYEIKQDSISIGRDVANDIVVDSLEVSRRHAQIVHDRDDFILRDLGSRNGSWLRGERVEERRLGDGDGLHIGPATIVFKRGFSAQELENDEETVLVRPGSRPTVVIVPGLMGSELWQGNDRIWPNVRTLMNPEVCRLPSSLPIEPRSIINQIVIVPNLINLDVYSRLGDYLVEGLGYQREVDLFEFAYDWRQDNRISAQRLAGAIEAWRIKGRIVIVAHSMGSLVSRYYIERLGGRRQVARVILLGGPFRGSPKAIETLITGHGMLPFGIIGERLKSVLSTFPSSYQLLPSHDFVFDDKRKAIDLYDDDSWVSEEQRQLLRAGREFRRELGLQTSVPAVCIFGYGLKTAAAVQLERDERGGWLKFGIARETSGDTVVPETSAVIENAEIHPVKQNHGALFVDNDVKMRLKMELMRLTA